MTTKITPTQARLLCDLIGMGNEVGVNENGDIVYAGTRLSNALDILDMDWDVVYAEPVVAMLRDWADALEKLNDNVA